MVDAVSICDFMLEVNSRLLVFSVVAFGVLLAANVGASCPDDQVIMKLYSLSNSHVALWNDEHSYNEEICYDSIFGHTYSGEAHPVCDENNAILWLSDTYNSHASSIREGAYNTPVCYGNLDCTARESSCMEGEKAVAMLSSNTNAHVSALGYGYPSIYTHILCCEENTVQQTEWRNLNKEIIYSTNISDTVLLTMTNSGLPLYSPVIFNIYEHDGIFNPDDYIGNITGIVDEDGTAVAYWKILRENLSVTATDYNEFYFNVIGQHSDFLSVSELEDDDPMNVIISSPICGSDYNKNSIITIEINATDPDDIIEGNLTVVDTVQPFTNGITTLDYTFNQAGNIQVSAFGINTRGYIRRTISNIMIVDTAAITEQKYVAACINKPEDFSDIASGTVNFLANQSRGLKWIPGTGGVNATFSELKFYWVFSDGRTNPNIEGANRLSYNFWKTFQSAGHNWATLEVEME